MLNLQEGLFDVKACKLHITLPFTKLLLLVCCQGVRYFKNQTIDSIGFIQNNKSEIKIKPRFKVS